MEKLQVDLGTKDVIFLKEVAYEMNQSILKISTMSDDQAVHPSLLQVIHEGNAPRGTCNILSSNDDVVVRGGRVIVQSLLH